MHKIYSSYLTNSPTKQMAKVREGAPYAARHVKLDLEGPRAEFRDVVPPRF